MERKMTDRLQKLCIKQAKTIYILDEFTEGLIHQIRETGDDELSDSALKTFRIIMKVINLNLHSLEEIAYRIKKGEKRA